MVYPVKQERYGPFRKPWAGSEPDLVLMSNGMVWTGGGAWPVQYECNWHERTYYVRQRHGRLTLEDITDENWIRLKGLVVESFYNGKVVVASTDGEEVDSWPLAVGAGVWSDTEAEFYLSLISEWLERNEPWAQATQGGTNRRCSSKQNACSTT